MRMNRCPKRPSRLKTGPTEDDNFFYKTSVNNFTITSELSSGSATPSCGSVILSLSRVGTCVVLIHPKCRFLVPHLPTTIVHLSMIRL